MGQLLAKKIGMTQIFDADGNAVPATVLEAPPMTVVRKKTKETDGYEAVQVGMIPAKEKHLSSPLRGHFKKNGAGLFRILKEIRPDNFPEIAPGQQLTVSNLLKTGDFLDAAAVTKGKGFQGTMKRHHYSGGSASHGGMSHRRPASGGETQSAKVYRGKRSPGHMGSRKSTIMGLEVLRVEPERNVIFLKGAVPGPPGELVFLRTSLKAAKKIHKRQTALAARQRREAEPKEKEKGKAEKQS